MLNTVNNTQSTSSNIIINVDTEPKINLIMEDQSATVLSEHEDDITLDVESGYENNYNKLKNKPSINGKMLMGDISTDELGLQANSASDIKYEDNFDNDAINVQEALDAAFTEILNLRENLSGIEEYENATIDLATFPVGVYYLKGIYTKIKYDSGKVMENIIKSDDQKIVLVALGGTGAKGKGIIFSGAVSATQVFIYVYGNGTWANYNVFNLMTSSRDEKVTGNWTFNTLPKSSVAPTSSNQLVTKNYVDNKFRQALTGTDLGYIDLDDGYDGDVFKFLNTITGDGTYRFVDSYDEFTWLVEVETVGNRIGQKYWYEEEGFTCQYYRDGWYDEDADEYNWGNWTNYVDWNVANDMFARKDQFNIIPEFDIEVQRNYNDVYNVPAIHQLLEIFAWEITQMQEELQSKAQVYIDVDLNFYPDEGRLSLRNWKTADAYGVADKANQEGKPVIARGSLYVDGEYMETVYLNQTLYADSWYGQFKYFLGMIDTEIIGFLRLEQGRVVVGMRQF